MKGEKSMDRKTFRKVSLILIFCSVMGVAWELLFVNAYADYGSLIWALNLGLNLGMLITDLKTEKENDN